MPWGEPYWNDPDADDDCATASIALPKLEQRIRVPSTGWQLDLEDSGGARSVTVPGGDYYLESVAPGGATRSLCDELAYQMTGGGAVTYDVEPDDDSDTSTGKVTISANGTFTATWVTRALRDLLGYEGTDTGAVTTKTGSFHALTLWLPNTRPLPLAPFPKLGEPCRDFGRPEYDYRVTTAPSGMTTQSVFSGRRADKLRWEILLGHKTWIAAEVVRNESAERWHEVLMQSGAPPFRFHSDRGDDDAYWTMVLDEEAAVFEPAQHIDGWYGELSHWRLIWPVRKWMPSLVDGVSE